jgi:pimeloyl-ACP methyl ester carboxylesterase
MSLPLLHFAHGNSYPGGTYGRLLDLLARDFDVRFSDRLGHDPRFPLRDNWAGLVDELIAQLDAYDRPAILVGHSMGGAVSLLAARRRPDLARCVVLLDAPIVAGWRALVWGAAKALGLGRRLSPGAVAERRRDTWPSRDAARAHFLAKPLFRAWAPGALDDYLDHGLAPHPDGVALRFDRGIEATLYATLPSTMGGILRRPFPVPVGFIAGDGSEELRRAGLDATRRLVGDRFATIPGTHLYPMEAPDACAALVRGMVARLLAEAAGREGASDGQAIFA